MVYVDAYYLYLYLNKLKPTDLPFKVVMRKMSYALMHNLFDEIETGERNPNELFDIKVVGGACEEADDDDTSDSSNSIHQAVPLRQIDGYTGSKQQWCAVYGAAKDSYACAACSSKNIIFPSIHLRPELVNNLCRHAFMNIDTTHSNTNPFPFASLMTREALNRDRAASVLVLSMIECLYYFYTTSCMSLLSDTRCT